MHRQPIPFNDKTQNVASLPPPDFRNLLRDEYTLRLGANGPLATAVTGLRPGQVVRLPDAGGHLDNGPEAGAARAGATALVAFSK